MKLLQLTLNRAAADVALDEALLETAEQTDPDQEVLRLWESPSPLVVIGRSSRVDVEVDREACRSEAVPIVRRCSGGAAVVAGPGCLMYAVVLSYRRRPYLRSIDQAHRFVLDTLTAALAPSFPAVRGRGISDLALRDRKISGNSLRCKRTHVLYHGTLLYNFALERIGRLLKVPPRQPDYREQRSHRDFVANLPADPKALRQALIEAFDAREVLDDWPRALTEQLVEDRYRRDDWNYRL
jgi:lipoate-protein ligase A